MKGCDDKSNQRPCTSGCPKSEGSGCCKPGTPK
jgi:hypothetical protein